MRPCVATFSVVTWYNNATRYRAVPRRISAPGGTWMEHIRIGLTMRELMMAIALIAVYADGLFPVLANACERALLSFCINPNAPPVAAHSALH